MPNDVVTGRFDRDKFSVLIAMATYNEMENVVRLVDAIRRLIPQADVLVVDDNSPDGTGDWVRMRSAEDKHVHGIHRAGKFGLGTATVAAMQFAIEHEYELLVTLDADWSHHPKYIPQLLAALAEHPQAVVAIGSRYVPGGGIDGWPLLRRLMSQVMNGYARRLLGLAARDCTGAFRCYRVAALKHIDWSACQAEGYAFVEEILWRLDGSAGTIVEIPIVFTDRQKGQSKLGWSEAIRSVSTLAALRWRGKRVRGGKTGESSLG